MADWRVNYTQYRRYFFDIVSLYKRRQDLRAFLEIILSIGTITLFVALAVRPTVTTISQLLTDIKTKEDTIAQMDTKIRSLGTAQNLVTQYAGQIALLETAIPDGPTPESIMKQIEGLAQKNNVSVLGSSVSNVTIIGQYPETKENEFQISTPEGAIFFVFSGTLEGDFPLLINFLSDLENLRRPLILDGVSITTVASQDTKRIVLSVTGRAPFLKQ